MIVDLGSVEQIRHELGVVVGQLQAQDRTVANARVIVGALGEARSLLVAELDLSDAVTASQGRSFVDHGVKAIIDEFGQEGAVRIMRRWQELFPRAWIPKEAHERA